MVLKTIPKYAYKYINPKIGLIAALIMGSIVFIINMKHGWFLSTTAAFKQGIYTFFFSGFIVKLLEYLVKKIKNPYLSIPASVLVISGFTSLLVYAVHSLKGTPEPLLSTVPTILMAPPGFLVLAIRFKRKQ